MIMTTTIFSSHAVFSRLKDVVTCISLVGALLLILHTKSSVEAAPGNTTIVNLTANTIYVATGKYIPPSQAMAGDYRGGFTSEYMVFSGYYHIKPGESRDFQEDYYYIENHQGRRVTWSNVKEIEGIAHSTLGFHKEIRGGHPERNPNSYTSELSKFLASNPAYIRVYFQRLDKNTRYRVTTPVQVYEIQSRSFNFEFRSHNTKLHSQCYYVPGTVVDYDVLAQRLHGPNERWNVYTDRICIDVVTKGKQPYPGAATQQGYFIGRLTIHYTVPR